MLTGQHLFDTLYDLFDVTPTEDEMFEIINAVEKDNQPVIRYDIYINGKLYRSTYNEGKILDIVRPFDDYDIKEVVI